MTRPQAFRPARPLRFEVFEAIVGRPAYIHSAWVEWKGSEAETFERYESASVDLSVRLRRGRYPFGSCGAWSISSPPSSIEEVCESFEARGLIASVATPSRRFVRQCYLCGGSGVSQSTTRCGVCEINLWSNKVGPRRIRGTGYRDSAETPKSINDIAHWMSLGEATINGAEGIAGEIGHRLASFGSRLLPTDITVSWIAAQRHRWRPTFWRARSRDGGGGGEMMPDIVLRAEPMAPEFRPTQDVTDVAARQFRFALELTDEEGTNILAPLRALHDLGLGLQDVQGYPVIRDGIIVGRDVNVVIAFPVTT